MYKKYYIAIALLAFSEFHYSWASSPHQSEAEQYGYDAIKGAVRALQESGPSQEDIAKIAQQVVDGILKGSNKSLQQGGEFHKLSETAGQGAVNFSKSLGEGVEESSTVLSEHMGQSFSNFMSELRDQTSKDSELDLAAKEFINLIKNNSNKFLNEFIYPNALTANGIALGVTAGFYAIPVMAKYIERELLNPTPKLIIESSKKSYSQYIASLFFSATLPAEMVFSTNLKQQLDDITKVTKTVNEKIKSGKTNVKYRNLMLYGPPGTGKTMFAKQLAKNSGLEYAFMSGSSFSKFKDGDGITALDELFAWAKNSKGLMIFIDEAENFLSKRENMDPQSKAYQLLNNFLNYTGEHSSQFMLVFATNHKDALDSAMYRRIDDLIEMPLPSKEQRMNALILYKNKILLDEKQNEKKFIESVKKEFNNKTIELIAEKTKGLSYGDLEGIINTIKTDTDILEPAIVTQKLIYTVVDRAVKKHDTFTNGKLLGTVED